MTPKLFGGWEIERPLCFFLLVLVFGLLIRLATSLLKAIEIVIDDPKLYFWKECRLACKGWKPQRLLAAVHSRPTRVGDVSGANGY